MDETVFFPSPNWFQPAGFAVSADEWLIYGGPSKSLCVLEPLPPDHDTTIKGQQGYTAHVISRAHPEKIVCVDICPEWPEKRSILTGSADGSVKQWSLEKTEKTLKVKPTHGHEIHSHEKEEVIGVGYCNDGYAVTVGSFGNIVKWDLNSNVAKSFNHVLKSFKPMCMACSPHLHMYVAVGTKQGVLFVLDLNGYPRIVYKVRGQDDEILKVSWCPQYEVAVRKALKERPERRSSATDRMEKIRKEPETPETLKLLDEAVKNSQTSEQPVLINEKSEPVVATPTSEALDESGIGKTLPEDSFDDCSVVQEDDMFDIYKDHETEEFGHKKFQPFDEVVKIPTLAAKDDYLAECLKLKEEILQRKLESETSIGQLVEALDKTQLEPKLQEEATQLDPKLQEEATQLDPKLQEEATQLQEKASTSKPDPPVKGKIIKGEVESSVHIHKHLLATISKHGSIRIWSKTGKLVGTCAVYSGMGVNKNNHRGKKQGAGCTTLLWARPDSLLIADGQSQLLDCNPLRIDCKNRLEWSVVHHLHARGLFALASTLARVQAAASAASARAQPGACWSAAQDRGLVRYCLRTRRADHYTTCGGFIYTVRVCPYDTRRVSVSVGDGNIRVWEADTLPEDDSKLSAGRTLSFWQNVQGKVLVTAWHPDKENLLAFSTAESRVGLLDTGGKERTAKVLQPEIAGGIYSLSWAPPHLLACGSGRLVQYLATKPDQAAKEIRIEVDGAGWEVSTVQWFPRGVLAGSLAGAVAVLSHDYNMQAAAFVFNKMIHTVDWHPQETSTGSGPSPYRNLIAVCSVSKVNTVVILKYGENEDDSRTLSTWRTLSGHSDTVLQVAWSPHRDHQLLSTSQDGTVRVWDVSVGSCTSIFGGHVTSAIGAAWSLWPAQPDVILSGGGDCCLRLWRLDHHPAHLYQAMKYEVSVDKNKKQQRARDDNRQKADEEVGAGDHAPAHHAVAARDARKRTNKKFLLPMIEKQTVSCGADAARAVLQRYLARAGTPTAPPAPPAHPAHPAHPAPSALEPRMEFINMFGNINELNELLDAEMERHCDTGALEAWLMLSVVRGQVDAAMTRAAAADLLDPFLLSIAPCVSFKYWKDVTLLYLQQIDRLTAKGLENKLLESRSYGGPVYRKMAVLLSLHDVKGAVSALHDAHLYREAYVLSRTRYMDSLAEQTLRLWAQFNLINTNHNLSAVCYIALGDLGAAAAALGKSSDEQSLSLAADIAKILGHNTFAGHIEGKRDLLRTQRVQSEQNLAPLPSKAQLVLEEAQKLDTDSDDTRNETDSLTDIQVNTEAKGQDALEDKPEIPEKQPEVPEAKPEIPEDKPEITEDKPETEDKLKKPEDKAEIPGDAANDCKPIDKTEELLKKLPESMEGLMKDSIQVLNGTPKGDGDTISNNNNTDEVDDKDIKTKILKEGDEIFQERAE